MAARQRSIIEGRINDRALFPNIIIAATERIRTVVGQAEGELREAAMEAIRRLKRDLELVLVAAAPGERGRSREVVGGLEELAVVVDGLKGDVSRLGDALGDGA